MPTSKPTKPVIGGLIALLGLLLAGVVLISVYVQQERQRDLDSWAIRLGMIAESRVHTIESWLTAQTDALDELANNASLQLYLWKLSSREPRDTAVEPAQLSFLRNLVLASAERYGFTPGPHQPEIPANLPKRYDAGLALIDAKHRHVVSTTGMPDIGVAFEAAIRTALEKGQPTFSELVPDAYDRVLLGIAVPVPVVLGARDNQSYGGVIFAVVSAERSLFPLLKTGISDTAGDESLLIMERGAQVVYLSPTRDGGTATRKTLPMDRGRLAAAIALRQPGSFGEYRNYQGHEVLATSRPLRSTPWLLLQEVDAKQALLESDRHRQFLVTAFSLLLFFFAAVLVAAWRHGSSVRARHDADALRRQTLALEEQTRLLHAVTDNAQAYVILMDARQQVLLANARLAARLHVTAAELAGNTLTGVLGPANVQPLAGSIEAVQKDGVPHHCALRMSLDGEELSLQCSLVPVERVGERQHAILLVLQDVTELQRAQRKHDALMRKLVATLMHVVDLHDPNSAHHSARLVEVANAVGRALKLGPEERRTLDLAASLANLGKIFVPREVLTKTEPLTEAEQALLQRHVQFGTEMLADLDFEGPVVDTIAQKQEHLDGSGYPNGEQRLCRPAQPARLPWCDRCRGGPGSPAERQRRLV
jgi:PAS domain S-box-containing protein